MSAHLISLARNFGPFLAAALLVAAGPAMADKDGGGLKAVADIRGCEDADIELGGVTGQSIVNTHDADYNLFTNVQSYYYRSATESASSAGYAWSFDIDGGSQFALNKAQSYHA